MKKARTSLIVAALLAGLAGGTVMAQNAPLPAPAAKSEHRHGAKDPAQRQARFEQRMAELKQTLQISPAQEGAWNAFTQAMHPPAQPPQRPDREALARMTTPERIDQMRILQTQRQAEMERRGEATKALYAALTPEQQKAFDAQSLQVMRGMRGMGGHGMHRHHG